jgi:hypothetical protein
MEMSMNRIIHWLQAAIAAWLVLVAAPAVAQPSDPAGLWALRADGRVLGLLALARDRQAPGGWSGSWTKPDRVTFNESHMAFDISGPVVTRAFSSVAVRGDTFEIAVPGRSTNSEPTVFTFRLVDPETAELGFKDVPFPPMSLSRATQGTTVDADWDPSRRYALSQPARSSNPEMRAIFEADQAARRSGAAIDWPVVEPQDRARRERTRQLLDAGALQSGDDFWHAAFVFQHGGEPNDYLLAHTLATVAIARGRPDATWIAAATLDRYLQRIGQKQIYGTQYTTLPGQPTTQEPYDRALISDALREALRVPDQAGQERQRAEFEAAARAREGGQR